MGFVSTFLSLLLGLLIGIVTGIFMTFYALVFCYSDEKFERTVSDLREKRKENK